jgi:hypothetical protein
MFMHWDRETATCGIRTAIATATTARVTVTPAVAVEVMSVVPVIATGVRTARAEVEACVKAVTTIPVPVATVIVLLTMMMKKCKRREEEHGAKGKTGEAAREKHEV